jgi:hypothetical protein
VVHVCAFVTFLVGVLALIANAIGQEVEIAGVVGVLLVAPVLMLYGLMWVAYLRDSTERSSALWALIILVPVFGSLAYYFFVWRKASAA